MSSSIINKNASLIILLLTIIGVPFIFYSTMLTMINTWVVDETFTHGFLIFPITIWLIWQKRGVLKTYPPKPEPRAFILLIFLLFIWLISQATGVQVIQQFSIIFLILSIILIVLGREVLILFAFPLLFLLFAVPFGKIFIPPLMDFTAIFTVSMIQISGIPIYQDGLFFTLPSGSWSVVEACSGVRYLIASVALGVIYAYISYNSLKKRLIFLLAAIVVPIIANGFRAYMIVMIGHLSGMELAVGVDHLIYGWIFFGIVIFLMFYIGSFWWDDIDNTNTAPISGQGNASTNKPSRSFIILLVAMITLLIPRVYAEYIQQNSKSVMPDNISLNLANNYSGWQLDKESHLGWEPEVNNPDIKTTRLYRYGTDLIQISIAYYHTQKQNSEAVSSLNRIESGYEGDWKKVASREVQEQIYVLETELINNNTKLLVWSWYRMGSLETPNKYIAKTLEAYNLLIMGRNDATLFAIATPVTVNKQHSRQQLRQFMSDASTSINKTIENLHKVEIKPPLTSP